MNKLILKKTKKHQKEIVQMNIYATNAFIFILISFIGLSFIGCLVSMVGLLKGYAELLLYIAIIVTGIIAALSTLLDTDYEERIDYGLNEMWNIAWQFLMAISLILVCLYIYYIYSKEALPLYHIKPLMVFMGSVLIGINALSIMNFKKEESKMENTVIDEEKYKSILSRFLVFLSISVYSAVLVIVILGVFEVSNLDSLMSDKNMWKALSVGILINAMVTCLSKRIKSVPLERVI